MYMYMYIQVHVYKQVQGYNIAYVYMYIIYMYVHVHVYMYIYSLTHVYVVHGLVYLQVVVVEEESCEVSQLPELRTEVLDGASDLQLRPLISLLFLRGLLTPHTNCPWGWEHRNVR